jgi:hypothetical protein
MTNSILPLANWGMGTGIIIFFAILCIVMSALVLSFVFGGKKKGKDEINSSKDDNF